jgi:glycosyltransferase involved in cell wall biosynthesis
MIRVLQFADIVNRYDFIDTIIRRADPARFQVGVCVRDSQTNIAVPDWGRQISQWKLNGAIRSRVPADVWHLVRILREWKPDILHAHHYDQAIIGWLATRLHPQTRLIIGRHYSNAIYRLGSEIKKQSLLLLERAVNTAATRLIVPSTMIQEILVTWQNVHPDKVDCIPYGFEPDKYAPPDPDAVAAIRQQFASQGQFLIGTFCRLHEEKGHRYLIEAAHHLKSKGLNFQILFVGEGPERKAIESQISAMQLNDRIILTGWRRDAMAIMAAVDAVVQPTLQEAFSQVMAEALWMEKPLVITEVSGATDIIQDGINGLLVPCENAEALSHAVERLMNDALLRRRLAAEGHRYVEHNLTADRIICRYEAAYLKAVEC